ncbi:MAG: ABC transporter ATP-binding protein [Acetobacteraceae bacterium]
MADLRVERLRRQFGAMVAVKDLSFVFPDQTVTCLLGPSGCGKTTLLRMIAGLEHPTAGTILFGNRDVTRLSARRRDVAMVFQYPVMYRTLSVIENIELPLGNDRTIAAGERRRRVEEVIEILELGNVRHLHIDRLDLGSRQKVAVGRAIARRATVTLFDEPTTNVEVHAKLALIRAFKELRRRVKETIVYVTHDQTEAMTLADQIALMHQGEIVQCAAPRELYEQPTSEFGGWFLGNPGMNFLNPRPIRPGVLAFDVLPFPLAAPAAGAEEIRLGIRPEHVEISAVAVAGAVPARVLRKAIAIGGQHLVTLAVGESRIKAKIPPPEPGQRGALEIGTAVFALCPLERAILFRGGERLAEPPRRVAATVAAAG